MTDIKSGKKFFGYVSAYLTRPPRSLTEAERDREAQQRLDWDAELQVEAKAALDRSKEPRS
jgi:hypothetical protein